MSVEEQQFRSRCSHKDREKRVWSTTIQESHRRPITPIRVFTIPFHAFEVLDHDWSTPFTDGYLFWTHYCAPVSRLGFGSSLPDWRGMRFIVSVGIQRRQTQVGCLETSLASGAVFREERRYQHFGCVRLRMSNNIDGEADGSGKDRPIPGFFSSHRSRATATISVEFISTN